MTNMYDQTGTWNFAKGCLFDCVYCGKRFIERYTPDFCSKQCYDVMAERVMEGGIEIDR